MIIHGLLLVSLNFLLTYCKLFQFTCNKAREKCPLDDGIECFFARNQVIQ